MSYLRTIIKKAGTIIGGRRSINLIEGSNITLTISDDSVNDEVDVVISSPTNGLLVYYFQNTASDVATYYAALNTPYTPSTALTTISGVVNAQVLYNFITASSSPSLTFIPAGLLQVNVHAYKSGGTKDVSVYAEIWETNSAGVDIGKICDTGNSILLTGIDADLYITYNLASPYTLTNSSSRIDCRIIANVTGGGSAPDLVFSVGGVTDSRISIPNNINTGGGGTSWGAITGTLSDQTDLQTALDNKLDDTQLSGVAKITVGTTTPVAPTTGDLWVDTN